MIQGQTWKELLTLLERPAFLASKEQILEVNNGAMQMGLEPGKPWLPMVCVGREEFSTLEQGSLCLTLEILGKRRKAAVRPLEDESLLVVLEQLQDGDTLRAYALAAQQLRKPLSEAMAAAALLQESWDAEEEAAQHMGEINRSLYQLLRLVGNMSETQQLAGGVSNRRETTEASAFFYEIFEKTAALAEQAGKTVTFSVPEKQIFVSVDRNRMERAVYNLVSNALRFTPKGGRVRLSLTETRSRLLVTVEDSGDGLEQKVREDLFGRYRREPGLEDERNGLGLGLTLVRQVAELHGGALMICPGRNGGTTAVLTLERKLPDYNTVRSPIFRFDYAGEHDHALVELSGELPPSLYKNL